MAQAGIGSGRKRAYYLGTFLVVAGFVVAFSAFFTGFSLFGVTGDFVGGAATGASRGGRPDPQAMTGFMSTVQSRVFFIVLQAVGGTALIIVGGLVRRVGSHGLAGAGLVLDPQRVRDEVRPWAQMQGGVLRDTLDAAGLTGPLVRGRPTGASSPSSQPDLPFDERLRRLHRLRQEGLLSEEEYQRERKEILDAN